MTKTLSFLSRYWEIIETYRRLFLTAVISVIGPGTSAQAVLAVLLALFCIKLYSVNTPYVNSQGGFLADVGQFQIFFTFFGALVIQGDLLGASYTDTIGVILVLMGCTILVVASYFQWQDTKDLLAQAQGVLDKGEKGIK
jgi:hypothetical protein